MFNKINILIIISILFSFILLIRENVENNEKPLCIKLENKEKNISIQANEIICVYSQAKEDGDINHTFIFRPYDENLELNIEYAITNNVRNITFNSNDIKYKLCYEGKGNNINNTQHFSCVTSTRKGKYAITRFTAPKTQKNNVTIKAEFTKLYPILAISAIFVLFGLCVFCLILSFIRRIFC